MQWLTVIAFALAVSIREARGTVVAAICSGGRGLVLGTDSVDAQGPLVDNRYSEKVIRINPLTLICVAAYNSDVRNLCSELRRVCLMHKADCDEVLGVDSVAHVARQLVHSQFKDAHVLVVGSEGKAAAVPKFCIHEILPGGSCIEQTVAVAGSGSKLIVSLMNELWEEQGAADASHLQLHDAAATAAKLKRALQSAIRSDPGSGGQVAMWSLTLEQQQQQQQHQEPCSPTLVLGDEGTSASVRVALTRVDVER